MASRVISHHPARTEGADSVRRTSQQPTVYMSGESSSTALRQANNQGLPIPTRPNGEMPDLPPDLTELGDSGLMVLFRQVVGWQKYLATQLALAETDEKSATRKLHQMEMRYDFRRSGAKAKAAGDPAYEQATEDVQRAFAYRRLVDALHAGIEQDGFLVSRELSRRLGNNHLDRRDSRWNA